MKKVKKQVAPAKDIRAELAKAETVRDIGKINRAVIKVLDRADDIAMRAHRESPEQFPDYAAIRKLRADLMPTGYPTSEGMLKEWVDEAKERIRQSSQTSRTREQARVDRVFNITDSSGRRRRRRR